MGQVLFSSEIFQDTSGCTISISTGVSLLDPGLLFPRFAFLARSKAAFEEAGAGGSGATTIPEGASSVSTDTEQIWVQHRTQSKRPNKPSRE